MLLRFVIKSLLLPPGGLLLLLLLGILLRQRLPKLSSLSLGISFLGFYLLSTPVLTEHLARYLETEPALAKNQWAQLAQQADAIVVLGAGREFADPAYDLTDQPSVNALQRLRYAARLAKASGLPILTSGGLHLGTREPSEAQIMADSLAQDLSVPTEWVEGSSRTTWENATDSAAILLPLNKTRVVLVTQAWHMPRSRWSFEQAGFQVISAPSNFLTPVNQRPLGGWLPEAQAIWHNVQLLNELAGQLVYPYAYSRPKPNMSDSVTEKHLTSYSP